MPTLPLYDTTAEADAWHHLRSPGGYECWRFDAEDGSGDVRLTGVICDGWLRSREYLKEYLRYRRRPTRHVPPVPADFPYAHVLLYRGDQLLNARTFHDPFVPHAPRSFAVGALTVAREENGSIQIMMMGAAASGELEGRLRFKPRWRHQTCETILFDRHHWLLSDSFSDVEAELMAHGKTLNILGRGYCDHIWGSSPRAAVARRWISGTVLLRERALALQVALPRGGSGAQPPDVRLIEASAAEMRILPVRRTTVNWPARGVWPSQNPVPEWVAFDDILRLHHPQTLEQPQANAPLVVYKATVFGEESRALCEVD